LLREWDGILVRSGQVILVQVNLTCAPFGHLYFNAFQLLKQTGLGARNKPGMALTLFPSSIG